MNLHDLGLFYLYRKSSEAFHRAKCLESVILASLLISVQQV